MMTNKDQKAAFGEIVKSMFTRNVALKIISLFFAMVLWGYVMTDQNPERSKQINDINVSFDGEADMISRKLIVRGNRTALLSDITANVSTRLTNYADLSADDIQATVSLRNITGAGVYELPINATCTNGSVQKTSPQKLSVEVDDLVTKRVPVEYKIVKDVPEGYWASTPTLSRNEIDIQGAATDIEKVIKGICYINLSERTESYNEAMPITLMGADSAVMDGSILYGQLASVSVQQTIMHKKTLPVNARAALMGADNLANNFEIAEIRVSPATMDVAGSLSVLDTLSEITVENIDIAGRSESLLDTSKVLMPEGITIIGDLDTISVYVDIREKTEEVFFEKMAVKVVGAARKDTVTLLPETVDMTVSGRTSLIKQLDRGGVTLYVDVTDLAAGTYTLGVQTTFPSETMQNELTWTLSQGTVSATIRAK